MTKTLVGHVVLFLALVSSALSECPVGCYCNNKFVDCSALMDFPMNLAPDTERFRVSQMNTIELPAHAFSYLVNITIIEIKSSNFGKIARCAFTDLPSVKRIVFDKSVIGSIEPYAFWGLNGIEQIELFETRIGRLKPFAFYKLANINVMSIIQSNLPIWYTHAFYDISNVNMLIFNRNNVSDMATGAIMLLNNVTSVQVTQNTFWNMHCGVLPALLDLGRTTQFFTNNSFYCNCSIASLVNTTGRVKYIDLLQKTNCVGPDPMKNKTSLWAVDFNEIGCTNIGKDTGLPCTHPMIIPNPQCVEPAVPEGEASAEGEGSGGNALLSYICTVTLVTMLSAAFFINT